MSRLDRVTSNPAVCHGQPTIRGLRYTVESVLELLAAGMTVDEVLADYLDLERDDILAALQFGARAAGRRRVVPLSASGGNSDVERDYASLVGLPAHALVRHPGSAPGWENATFPGTTAFVVELPAGTLSRASIRRPGEAVLSAGRGVARGG